MPRVAELREEIKNTQTLRTIADSLSEISSMKIVHIRQNFEKNKDFYAEVEQLYKIIKLNARRDPAHFDQSQIDRSEADTERTKQDGGNGTEQGSRESAAKQQKASAAGRLDVAVTTNQRFYGLINLEVSQKFKEETEKKDTNRLMIGRSGSKYLEALGDKSPFKRLNFERDIPSAEEIHVFLEMAKPYEKVVVYYPKFVSMFSQIPEKVDITHSPATTKLDTIAPEQVQFIFEPELEKVLQFFETHIRYLLFKRVMLDVELAVTASRLMAMSRASDRAGETLGRQRRLLTKQKRALINARLLEATVGTLGAQRW